jgi:dihydroxyacetone kinase
MTLRSFYNHRDNLVSEAIDGLVAASGGRVVRFAPEGHARVVLRSDWDKSKVAIVSGGGSGHEPAHAGLVGKGLLTAAVCGEIFASPSVDAVLSAIVAVTGPPGCLLIVKNYTGDRLNFGLAAEKAKSLGYKIDMVIVADDVAIPNSSRPRGIAGTVFIHKIAGDMSEHGAALEDIVRVVSNANGQIRSIGVARDTCTVPGNPKEDRIDASEVEIGLGIHGEAGVEVRNFESSEALMHEVSRRLVPCLDPAKRYAALFNNLGGLTGLECAVLFREFSLSDLIKHVDFTLGPLPIMTALDMPGFSISMIPLDLEYAEFLLSDVPGWNWPRFNKFVKAVSVVPPILVELPPSLPSRDPVVRAIVEKIATTCIDMEAALNALDAKVGDGDTGSTFAAAARSVLRELERFPFADGKALFSTLSDLKRKSMGGSSGVLLAIYFANASESFKRKGLWLEALSAGLEAMQRYGGAKVGDRTMIDALKPALDALLEGGTVQTAAIIARHGADSTKTMRSANAGRSAYLDARTLEGNADPGAEAIALIFEACASLDRPTPG